MKNTAVRQDMRFGHTRPDVENDQSHIPIKVLIVEDSEDKATLEVLELYRGGFYPFFELVNNPKAIETALRNYKWDLVISGDYLKQIGAFETLSLLRSSGQNMPFVVVAESLEDETAKALIRSGAQVVRTGELNLLSSAVRREFLRIGDGSFQKLLRLLRHIKQP